MARLSKIVEVYRALIDTRPRRAYRTLRSLSGPYAAAPCPLRGRGAGEEPSLRQPSSQIPRCVSIVRFPGPIPLVNICNSLFQAKASRTN